MTGPGLHGRRLARALLVVALLVPAFALLVFLSQPNTMGRGPWEGPSLDVATSILVLGGAMYLFGLGLMIRFYRGTFEPRRSSFRATRR